MPMGLVGSEEGDATDATDAPDADNGLASLEGAPCFSAEE